VGNTIQTNSPQYSAQTADAAPQNAEAMIMEALTLMGAGGGQGTPGDEMQMMLQMFQSLLPRMQKHSMPD
jgi:hypothetical protein